MATIFDELAIGDFALKNRFIMASLTRMRSKQPGNIPWELNAEYYRQRVSAGLIVSDTAGEFDSGAHPQKHQLGAVS